jgi:hypothetical protein
MRKINSVENSLHSKNKLKNSTFPCEKEHLILEKSSYGVLFLIAEKILFFSRIICNFLTGKVELF